MNYIELINQFWQTRRTTAFSSNESDLYFALLQECNIRGWENPFECSNKSIIATIGCTEKTLIEVRNRLQQKGLIEFEKGKRKEKSPVYTILNCNKVSIKVSKTVSIKESKTVSKTVHSLYKHKTKTKTKEREEETPSPEPTLFDKFKNTLDLSLSDCYNSVNENEAYLEVLAMNNKLGSVEKAREWLNTFFKKLQNEGVEEKSINDFKSHFGRWLPKKLKDERQNIQTGGGYSKTRSLQPIGGVSNREKDYTAT